MAYEIDCRRALDDEARRILTELAVKARAQLADAADDVERAVFSARRRCKRARALLRLIRPALDRDDYASENARWRDAGRALSGLRDASAVRSAVVRLARESADEGTRDIYQRLDGRLRGEAGPPISHFDAAARLARAEYLIGECARRTAQLSFISTGIDMVAIGARKTYARGREEMRAASREASADADHDWRKRVKYHALHLRLLRGSARADVLERETLAKSVAARLGEMNDFAVLSAEVAEGVCTPFLSADECDRLLEDLRVRRDVARARVFDDADALYALKPSAFEKAIGAITGSALAVKT